MTKIKHKQLRHLSQSTVLEEAPGQGLVRVTALTICTAFAVFIGWTAIAKVNEVARVPGEVTPNGYVQVVQHLEGGMIGAIMVEEGDLVQQGQVMIRLEGSGAQEDLQAITARQIRLRLEVERLRSFANNTQPDFKSIAPDHPDLLQEQQDAFDAMRAASDSELKVINDQIEQKQQFLETLKTRKQTLSKDIQVSQEILKIEKTTQASGSSSRVSLLRAEQDVNKLRGERAEIENEMTQAMQAIEEYKSRKNALNAQKRDEVLEKLTDLERQISENKEMVSKTGKQVERLEVRAPVRGLVKGLEVNTIGGVIGSGQKLMEVVPLDRKLIVEIRIPPRHIGHVQNGQEARVKVSAYDFVRYGAIKGKLEKISATTFNTPEGETYYKGRIVLEKNYVGNNPERNVILPGMTVQADIITGEKTILGYLMKPIQLSLDAALSER